MRARVAGLLPLPVDCASVRVDSCAKCATSCMPPPAVRAVRPFRSASPVRAEAATLREALEVKNMEHAAFVTSRDTLGAPPRRTARRVQPV